MGQMPFLPPNHATHQKRITLTIKHCQCRVRSKVSKCHVIAYSYTEFLPALLEMLTLGKTDAISNTGTAESHPVQQLKHADC